MILNTILAFSMFAMISIHAAEPLIVAHRGASGDAPENTLPAFNLAWKQGADAIEADFHLTKDGHIVCIHDRDTKRVSSKKLLVKQTTLAELLKLDVGSWKNSRFKETRIPTIAEVFATVPNGKKIYIELKVGPQIVPQLLADIKKSSLSNDQIVVICFDPSVIASIKKQVPKIKAIWLCSFKLDAQGKPTPATPFKTLQQIKADGISTSTKYVGAKFINYCKSQQYEHHIWTVDDPEAAKSLRDWGTLSITTNYPELIRKALTPVKAPVLVPTR